MATVANIRETEGKPLPVDVTLSVSLGNGRNHVRWQLGDGRVVMVSMGGMQLIAMYLAQPFGVGDRGG